MDCHHPVPRSALLLRKRLITQWATCGVTNPTIMVSALEYPNTIVLRVGLMYSLFILFLVNLFIKWWLDGSQVAKHTLRSFVASTIGLAAYALFVSTIDRKRINYNLAEWAVFVAAIGNFISVFGIYSNIKKIREDNPYFIGYVSWTLKKYFMTAYLVGMALGLMIYLGQLDIYYKGIVEYVVVVSTYLFYWTFSMDFTKYEMDIDRMAQGNPTTDLEIRQHE